MKRIALWLATALFFALLALILDGCEIDYRPHPDLPFKPPTPPGNPPQPVGPAFPLGPVTKLWVQQGAELTPLTDRDGQFTAYPSFPVDGQLFGILDDLLITTASNSLTEYTFAGDEIASVYTSQNAEAACGDTVAGSIGPQSVWVELSDNTCSAWVEYDPNLVFMGAFEGVTTGPLIFDASSQFAYGLNSGQFVALTINNGINPDYGFTQPATGPGSVAEVINLAATNPVAETLQVISDQTLVTMAIDPAAGPGSAANGSLTTAESVPINLLSPTAISISPDGAHTAVSGSDGLQIDSQSVALPSILSIAWDRYNHLFALGTGTLYCLGTDGTILGRINITGTTLEVAQ